MKITRKDREGLYQSLRGDLTQEAADKARVSEHSHEREQIMDKLWEDIIRPKVTGEKIQMKVSEMIDYIVKNTSSDAGALCMLWEFAYKMGELDSDGRMRAAAIRFRSTKRERHD